MIPMDVGSMMRRALDIPPMEPDQQPPMVFAPQQMPSARLRHAEARAQTALLPTTNFDELTAPDELTTAQALRGQTDPVRVTRTAAILAKYGEGTLDATAPEAKLAATQLDWAKVASLFRSGKVADPGKVAQWDRLEDLDDDEVTDFSEFVRRIGDITDQVYQRDLDFDPKTKVVGVEVLPSGPALLLSGTGRSMFQAERATPERLPYIAGGKDGAAVLPDGSIAVIGTAAARQSAVRHLEPLVTRPDGVSLWAARAPLRVMDAIGWQRKIDNDYRGHHIERWTASAFAGRHPALRPDRTVLVDLIARGAAEKVGRLGYVTDPGEPAVVVVPDPEDIEQRMGTRARRLAVTLADDADLADTLATARLYGAEPVAVYAPGEPPAGWGKATEQHMNDGVVSVVVRHNAGPPQTGEFVVFLPNEAITYLPTFRPAGPTWTRSGGAVDYGVALCVDGILGKKSLSIATNPNGIPVVTEGDMAKWRKGVYVVEGDPEDLLPAARNVQLLRQLGQKARLEMVYAGKRIELS